MITNDWMINSYVNWLKQKFDLRGLKYNKQGLNDHRIFKYLAIDLDRLYFKYETIIKVYITMIPGFP